MDPWIARLREKAARIARSYYHSDPSEFADAPPDIAGLSADLDVLAQVLVEREAVRVALIRDVHHRVKNNLQLVTSLVDMQASKVRNPGERQIFVQTRARMATMALIHRLLYEQDEDIAHGMIDIAEIVSELCDQFRLWHQDQRHIAFSCHASTCALRLDSAMPLALFATEAVCNAYAHAFPDGREGRVALDFSVTGNGIGFLSVSDDGVGFDSELHRKSIGCQLMQGFADQLGGTLLIASELGKGTAARLEFRIGA